MNETKREPGVVRENLTLANVFTAARLVLTPIFAVLWFGGKNQSALIVFAAAATTDLVDGLLARALDQRSRFGALFDPIADKLLILTALCVGMVLGVIPLWFGIIVIARDAVLAFGAVALLVLAPGRLSPDDWKPSRIGKTAVAIQNVSVLSAVGASYLASVWMYVELIMIPAAVLTVIAGLQYAVRSITALSRPTEGES